MPSWAAVTLAVLLGLWSFGVGIAFGRQLTRLWFRPGSSAWRTAARVLLLHGVLITLLLMSGLVVLAVREETTYRTWLLGGLLVATLVPLGPVVANVLPSRSGLAPDKGALARAGADEGQAAVVRWLGAPFAIIGMAMLVTVCFPALAA